MSRGSGNPGHVFHHGCRSSGIRSPGVSGTPAGGALGVAAASQPGPALRLAGELVVLRLILFLARVCGTARLPRVSHAERAAR